MSSQFGHKIIFRFVSKDREGREAYMRRRSNKKMIFLYAIGPYPCVGRPVVMTLLFGIAEIIATVDTLIETERRYARFKRTYYNRIMQIKSHQIISTASVMNGLRSVCDATHTFHARMLPLESSVSYAQRTARDALCFWLVYPSLSLLASCHCLPLRRLAWDSLVLYLLALHLNEKRWKFIVRVFAYSIQTLFIPCTGWFCGESTEEHVNSTENRRERGKWTLRPSLRERKKHKQKRTQSDQPNRIANWWDKHIRQIGLSMECEIIIPRAGRNIFRFRRNDQKIYLYLFLLALASHTSTSTNSSQFRLKANNPFSA